ncbi:phage major capsid protein [Bosea sp. 685]|uniref:phage major capsid protein n=1 Tax=Bosea sp. 685 TaxID=3080057 RepID=UPI002893726B|nr:phage major capsid protein [Bosea sp. 685]WNJ93040.1 phage major capsid protein [Bosea sp. 685]
MRQITPAYRQRAAAPGIGFARLATAKALARLDGLSPLAVARQRYGEDSVVVATIKAAVAAGSTTAGNWAADLISAEGGVVFDFLAYLRPATILGKFGANGVPALRAMPFRVPVVTQTGGGAGYWVGEGKAKPLTAFDFDRSTLEPLKVANICVLTEESIRDSSPSSEAIVRDSLRDALAARLDIDFINPAKTASAGVSPASITNGAATVASTGTDADAVRLDVRAVFSKFIAAGNTPSGGVWVMSSTTALALALMVNALGQAEFPGVGMTGGSFMGLPVVVSDFIGNIVVLAKTSEIFVGEDGGVSVDLSRDATLEMSDAPGQDALTGTGSSMVSMFQVGAVALRAERTINWKRARASAVAYLTGVSWGGTVPVS